MSAKKDRKQSNKAAESRTYGEELKRALNWVLKDGIFDTVTLHGNANWTAVSLVQVAVFWVWHPESSLVTAAGEAIAMVNALFGPCGIGSYQTLTNALATYSKFLVPVMWRNLQELMESCGGDSYRVGPWVVLAVDGSRVGVPRTRPNEQRFCKPSRGKKNKRKGKKRGRHAQGKRKTHRKSHYDPQAVGPQMWLTLVWHIGLRMPWCWKTGPSYSSERAHVLEIIEEQKFPESTLFCGDAGFVGYQFWSEIQQHHHHFLMRVGSNVRLLKRLGYVRESHGIVYSWPEAAMKKKQPPLALRLLHFHDGRKDVYLVTNVLDERKLTARQASAIYRARWGIELQFRSLKQTFQRSRLRSRTPDRAEIELHWSLIGLWMIQLLAFREQSKLPEPGEQTSVAAAIRVIRDIMHKSTTVPPRTESMSARLAEATTDGYQRRSKKKSRNYPRRKEEPSAGKPVIRVAKAEHKRKLKEIQHIRNAA